MISTASTDWLGINTVFYNDKTKLISKNINDVIDYNNIEFDSEGLNNYLEFGYSVFGQTPIKNVKFLRHSSTISRKASGQLIIENHPDPVEKFYNKRIDERDVLDLIKSKVQEWEKEIKGDIIIPTSGGYDSRLLNYFIHNKDRIRAFTYGISLNQSWSHEVQYAKRLASKLKIKWEMISLGDYHNYINDWYSLYGASTHLHGMYHIEFYKNILLKVATNPALLSGIVGDVWAGSIEKMDIDSIDSIIKLGYNHKICGSPKISMLKSENSLKEQFWLENRYKLKDEFFQIVQVIRFKIILLSYLIKLPNFLGFEAWSPFLDLSVAMNMLNIDVVRKRKRVWLSDFFQRNALNVETKFRSIRSNTLDLIAANRIPFQPLDVNKLKEIIDPTYVEWVNSNVHIEKVDLLFHEVKQMPFIRRIYKATSRKVIAYNSYIVLKPLELLIKSRK